MVSFFAAAYCKSGMAERSAKVILAIAGRPTSEAMGLVNDASKFNLVLRGIVLETLVDGCSISIYARGVGLIARDLFLAQEGP